MMTSDFEVIFVEKISGFAEGQPMSVLLTELVLYSSQKPFVFSRLDLVRRPCPGEIVSDVVVLFSSYSVSQFCVLCILYSLSRKGCTL